MNPGTGNKPAELEWVSAVASSADTSGGGGGVLGADTGELAALLQQTFSPHFSS